MLTSVAARTILWTLLVLFSLTPPVLAGPYAHFPKRSLYPNPPHAFEFPLSFESGYAVFTHYPQESLPDVSGPYKSVPVLGNAVDFPCPIRILSQLHLAISECRTPEKQEQAWRIMEVDKGKLVSSGGSSGYSLVSSCSGGGILRRKRMVICADEFLQG